MPAAFGTGARRFGTARPRLDQIVPGANWRFIRGNWFLENCGELWGSVFFSFFVRKHIVFVVGIMIKATLPFEFIIIIIFF